MTKIDWSKWSAIAEILSAVAILITLVYLAVQTRFAALQIDQNTATLLAANRQAALDAELEWLYLGLDHPEIGSAIDYPSLTGSSSDYDRETFDKARIAGVAFLRMRENTWLNYRSGSLDRETWEGHRGVLLSYLQRSEFFRAVWDRYSGGLAPGFQDEINSRLND
jgi:hypothetical protein